MGFAAQAVGVSCGVDTIAVFTAPMAQRMKASMWGKFVIAFVIRYVSLTAPFALSDITIAERDRILAENLLLGLVQHVERPSWQANAGNGTSHGQAAAAHAKAVEYPAGCHLGLDMEGLGDQGAPVLEYVRAWAKEVHAAGYLVAMYEGYDDGLTMAQRQQLHDEGTVDLFWSDYGPRVDPPGIGFAMHQHPQTMLAGVEVDPDTAAPDMLGRQFMAMGIVSEPQNDVDPAAGTASDPAA